MQEQSKVCVQVTQILHVIAGNFIQIVG